MASGKEVVESIAFRYTTHHVQGPSVRGTLIHTHFGTMGNRRLWSNPA